MGGDAPAVTKGEAFQPLAMQSKSEDTTVGDGGTEAQVEGLEMGLRQNGSLLSSSFSSSSFFSSSSSSSCSCCCSGMLCQGSDQAHDAVIGQGDLIVHREIFKEGASSSYHQESLVSEFGARAGVASGAGAEVE